MSNKEIRYEATQIHERTSGISSLFLFPVLLTFFSVLIDRILEYMFGFTGWYLFSEFIEAGGQVIQQTYFDITFSSFFAFLSKLLIVTGSFQLLKVVRNVKKSVSYQESIAMVMGDIRGFLIFTLLLRELISYLALLPAIVGFGFIVHQWRIEYSLLCVSQNSLNLFSFLSNQSVLLGLTLCFLGFFTSLFFDYGFSLVTFLLYDSLESGINTSLLRLFQQSWQLMKGHKWRRFLLDLSFIGWWIGILLTVGLLAIYVYPYYWTCIVLFYEDLKARNPLNLKSKKINKAYHCVYSS